MRNLIILVAAASTATFWASSDDSVENRAHARAPSLVEAAPKTDEVPFAQAWPALAPTFAAPPLAANTTFQAAPETIAPQAPAPGEIGMSEADLRRITEVEIARMKNFGIGVATEGVGIEEGMQAPQSEATATTEHWGIGR